MIPSEWEAAIAYDKLAVRLFGEFARTNFTTSGVSAREEKLHQDF